MLNSTIIRDLDETDYACINAWLCNLLYDRKIRPIDALRYQKETRAAIDYHNKDAGREVFYEIVEELTEIDE